MKQIRAAVESRNSVCHSATVLCNALMHAGTTVDTFLRENLDWLSRATNWARFSATAGMGVIHHGQLAEGRTLMGPFLPREGGAGGMRPSPYTEGGALYALGLIHANHGDGILPFLLESGRSSGNEVIQHGACLGMGLAALGTANEEVYTDMFRILRTDGAVAGEGAGIGMGLLLAGAAGPESKQREILNYCHKTQHEKIIRGCSVGLALTAYGKEESAEPLVEQMVREFDPIIRYGGRLAVAAAYAATGNNAAVRRLLHVAVSDVSDDVRRAAVMSLGFVLCSTPAQCPRVVALLAESYNPHVRYGAAMAVGICCAGTGMKEAVALLEPMLTDATDFVQQGRAHRDGDGDDRAERDEPRAVPQAAARAHQGRSRGDDDQDGRRHGAGHRGRGRAQRHHRLARAIGVPAHDRRRLHAGVHAVLVLAPALVLRLAHVRAHRVHRPGRDSQDAALLGHEPLQALDVRVPRARRGGGQEGRGQSRQPCCPPRRRRGPRRRGETRRSAPPARTSPWRRRKRRRRKRLRPGTRRRNRGRDEAA